MMHDTTLNRNVPVSVDTTGAKGGLASDLSLVGQLNDPLSFYEPERIQARLIWSRSAYLEWSFPSRTSGVCLGQTCRLPA